MTDAWWQSLYEEAGLKIVNHDYPDEAVDSTRLEIGYLLKRRG